VLFGDYASTQGWGKRGGHTYPMGKHMEPLRMETREECGKSKKGRAKATR